MRFVIRFAGLLLPAIALVAMRILAQPRSDEPRGAVILVLYVGLVAAAFGGGVLLRSCLGVALIPIVILLASLLWNAFDSAERTSDVTALGDVLYTLMFLLPIAIAAGLGSFVGAALQAPRSNERS